MNIIFPIAEVVAVKTGCDLIAGNLIGINKPKAIAAYSIAGSAAQAVATFWGAVVATPILLSGVVSNALTQSEITQLDPTGSAIVTTLAASIAVLTAGWITGVACGKQMAESTGNPLAMREILQLSVASTLLTAGVLGAQYL